MQTIMTLERFTTLIEAYGGNPQRWDVSERQAALTLLAQSAEAQHLQRQALAIDALLDTVPAANVNPFLAQRIANHLPTPVDDSWQWIAHWLWGEDLGQHFLRPALALVLPLMCGLWLGLNVANQQQSTATSQVALEQFSQNEFDTLLNGEATNDEWATWL